VQYSFGSCLSVLRGGGFVGRKEAGFFRPLLIGNERNIRSIDSSFRAVSLRNSRQGLEISGVVRLHRTGLPVLSPHGQHELIVQRSHLRLSQSLSVQESHDHSPHDWSANLLCCVVHYATSLHPFTWWGDVFQKTSRDSTSESRSGSFLEKHREI